MNMKSKQRRIFLPNAQPAGEYTIQEKNILGGLYMRKEKTIFWLLRGLVRRGELSPAYARQIYERHMKLSGKEIPFGHALWFRHGWAYDRAVWGSEEVAKDYYDEYIGSSYCPVDRLPDCVGYDRRKLKARVFGHYERKKAEKNYLPVEYIVEDVFDEINKETHTEITKIKVGKKVFEIIPAHRVWDIDMKFAGHHRRGYRMYMKDTETGKKYTILLAGIRKIEVIYDTELEKVTVKERIYKDEDKGYAEKIMEENIPENVEKVRVAGKSNPRYVKAYLNGLVPYVAPDVQEKVAKWANSGARF